MLIGTLVGVMSAESASDDVRKAPLSRRHMSVRSCVRPQKLKTKARWRAEQPQTSFHFLCRMSHGVTTARAQQSTAVNHQRPVMASFISLIGTSDQKMLICVISRAITNHAICLSTRRTRWGRNQPSRSPRLLVSFRDALCLSTARISVPSLSFHSVYVKRSMIVYQPLPARQKIGARHMTS